MKVVLLGGNSPKNENWLKDLRKELKILFSDIYLHKYSHWQTGQEVIDLDKELEKLSKELKDQKNYIIIAKSAGAILALKGIKEKILTPKACIFMGTAIIWAKYQGHKIEKWLKGYFVPTLFILNSKDPAISPEDLMGTLEKQKVSNYKMKILLAKGHDYLDFKKIYKSTKDFIKE